MTTPPDKCPKCGAELRWPESSFACKSFYLRTGEFIEDPLCLMTQRANREHERAEKWKNVALAYREQTCLLNSVSIEAIAAEAHQLLSEEQQSRLTKSATHS